MSEREAEALAARLTRIWMPDGSYGEGATWILQDGHFQYNAQITEGLEMQFGSRGANRDGSFHLQRTRDGQITGHLYCLESEGELNSCLPQMGGREEDFAQFAHFYSPIMRGYCWLSGCAIEASEAEQEMWTGWQREREEAGQGEPTNTVDFEIQRVAAAFGVKSFTTHRTVTSVHYEGWLGDTLVTWRLGDPNARVTNICVGTRSYCGVFRKRDRWEWESGQEGHEQMARGLYCLGFEDEDVLAQLNRPLSMHEKIELRLSMPREFWPKKWCDEEAASS
ncbi:hypothetical protein EON83_08515 [bacterium]|nr:MAG: hypothetical protein EON83_08515 [bacterium]